MGDINDELSEQLAALRAQLDKIGADSTSEATRTALLDNYKRIRNMLMHVSVLEPSEKPGAETTRAFLELTAAMDPLLPTKEASAKPEAKRKPKEKPPAQKLPFATALSKYATPDTVRVVTYVQIVRDGLKGLCGRQEDALREVQLLRFRSVVVSHELASVGRRLTQIKEVLDEMKPIVERFSFVERTEVVLLEEPDSFTRLFEQAPIPQLLTLLQQMHGMQQQQSRQLTEIEEILHRMKFN